SETDGCRHLQFDFFRNTWMVKHQQATVPVPKISSLAELDIAALEDEGTEPWMDAVDPSLIAGGSSNRPTPWWSDGTPLIDELYDYVSEYKYVYYGDANEEEE